MRVFRQLNQNTQGILCLLTALAFLIISDSIVKWLSPTMTLHQIMLIRGSVALLLVLLCTHFFGGLAQLKTQRPGLHLLRGLLLVTVNLFFFLGLATMPMTTTVVLFFLRLFSSACLRNPFWAKPLAH